VSLTSVNHLSPRRSGFVLRIGYAKVYGTFSVIIVAEIAVHGGLSDGKRLKFELCCVRLGEDKRPLYIIIGNFTGVDVRRVDRFQLRRLVHRYELKL
jgi:phage protein U